MFDTKTNIYSLFRKTTNNMKFVFSNFEAFLTILMIVPAIGFQHELCKPGHARYIDSYDVKVMKASGSTATWVVNEPDTIEWSIGNNNEDMILEIELTTAKNVTEIHSGERTTISIIKMLYSKDGVEWDYQYFDINRRNEKEETVLYAAPILIKYLKLWTIATYSDPADAFIDFKIVVCQYNDILK